ncbi:MAG: glycosyltransferase family 4 protein [Anaerolineae bacterium]|nr:glycosyltransferase family 4 protein [Anaerolineae bacterium]
MKLLFIADGRSPIALNWIGYFVAQGHEVHLASLYPCQPDLRLASLSIIPVAFSGAVEQGSSVAGRASLKKRLMRAIATPAVRTWLRHTFVPRSLPKAATELQSLIDKLQPDLIHAMRIPYEGMLAALVELSAPLLISVWGNDFTLHAPATHHLTRLTKLALQRADALHTDCQRDLDLARQLSFAADKPGVVLPGGGGIQMDVFYPHTLGREAGGEGCVIINPRGLRAYVRSDTFFEAVPRVLARHPEAQFICPAMQNQPEAESWASRLGAGDSLSLLPRLSRVQMAAAYRQAQIVLSITEHDGTPNTLLEALACGCFPIVGDIPSLREWIRDGENGFLVDPGDADALAKAVGAALLDPELRARAREINLKMIAARAEYGAVMERAEQFYSALAK